MYACAICGLCEAKGSGLNGSGQTCDTESSSWPLQESWQNVKAPCAAHERIISPHIVSFLMSPNSFTNHYLVHNIGHCFWGVQNFQDVSAKNLFVSMLTLLANMDLGGVIIKLRILLRSPPLLSGNLQVRPQCISGSG